MPTTEQSTRPEPRRRNRRPKACRICQARKVRCDYQQPCGTCVRRHQAQLCTYGRRSTTTAKSQYHSGRVTSESHSSPSPGPGPASDQQHSSIDNTSPARLLTILDHMAATATASCNTDDATGQVTFVGRRAHATLFRALMPYLPEQALPPSATVETIFGLTNRSISQPFVSLWNTTARITVGDILHSLPSPEACLRFYRSYQQIGHLLFPVISAMGAFERSLCVVLQRLVVEVGESSSSPVQSQLAADLPRAELVEYALLFAVLASGCQSCLVAEDDHQLALFTRVFVACSFECLSLANMYVSPSSETIQALLILACVNCNDGNPGVTMTMLGMAAQQAQGLGMHTRCECSCSSTSCECLETFQPVWRAVLTLDSKLSMVYDRVPISCPSDSNNGLQSLTTTRCLQFWDSLFSLHCLQIRWQSLDGHCNLASIPGDTVDWFLEQTAQLGQIAHSDKSSLCRPNSVQATLEQLVFTIHLDFFQGTLHLQAAISSTRSPERRRRHFDSMASKFCSVIGTYLKLRQLSPISKLAWEIIRAFKASILLLAAFEVILQATLSGHLLQHLADLLSGSSDLRSWRDDPLPSSCLAGIETIGRLLHLRYCVPEVVAEGANRDASTACQTRSQ